MNSIILRQVQIAVLKLGAFNQDRILEISSIHLTFNKRNLVGNRLSFNMI